MANGKQISNDKLYERLDSIRLELKQDIVSAVSTVSQNQGRLESKFDTLEAGRLTRLEGTVTDLRVRLQKYEGDNSITDATISTKLAVIWAIGGAIVIVGSEVILNLLTRGK
jgi:hypothetical protein